MDKSRNVFDMLKELIGRGESGPAGGDAYGAYLAFEAPDEAELERERKKTSGARALIVIGGGGRERSRVTVDSIAAQTYGNYEITDDPMEAEGDFVIRMRAGDALSPDALYRFALAFEDASCPGMVYCDEDTISNGARMKPFFKPGYSGITALSLDMFGAGWACKKNLYFSASAPHSGRADEEPGAGFDFALRCLKLAGSAMHIPRVLYSVGAPRHAIPERAGVAAIERFCSPLGERLRATGGKYQGSFRTGCRAWPPKTSIVIPNRDDVDSLRACLETIEETSSIFEPELIIADGGSVSERTNKYYEILAGNKAARIVRAKGGFGALSNAGALEASGDALLFLSRDARLASPGLIPALAEQAGRRGAGCAGALVLDENGRIVSSGNTAGLSGMLSSPFEGAEYGSLSGRTFETYIDTVRATLAVSGVCMYVRTDVFRSAGGFDESFDTDSILPTGADAELCVRLMRRGMMNIYTPFAKAKLLAHPERPEQLPEKVRTRCYDILRESIVHGDPYFNINLVKHLSLLNRGE